MLIAAIFLLANKYILKSIFAVEILSQLLDACKVF